MAYGLINSDTMADSSGGVMSPISSVMRNRIINGSMTIDQRNAGASGTGTNVYTVDRWSYSASQTGKLTWQQNAGSVTPPAGFSNYLGFTSSSAYSIGASDYFFVYQPIEGFNTADLGFGTANAKTVTLSFQVYSSLTGTFGGALKNGANNLAYPFTYSIPVANTWTTISVTIAGPTSGTWVGATNGVGLFVQFGLGAGSSFSGTAGSWQSGNLVSATGATSVVGTSGATFYITGVQLEKGSSATGYEYRQYQQELALCQRYFSKTYDIATVPGTATFSGAITSRVGSTENYAYAGYFTFPVSMRTNPSITIYSPLTGASAYGSNNIIGNFSAATTQPAGTAGVNIQANNTSTSAQSSNYAHVVATAEL